MDDLTYNDDRHYAVNEAEGIDLFDEVLAAEGRYQAPTYDDDTVELSSRFDSRVTRRLTRLLNHRDDSAREFAMARLPTRVVWDDTVEPYILTLDGGPVMVRVIGRLVDINYGCTRTNTPTIRLHLNQVRVGDHIALVWLYETQAATPTHYPPHVVVERDVVEGQSFATVYDSRERIRTGELVTTMNVSQLCRDDIIMALCRCYSEAEEARVRFVFENVHVLARAVQ